MTYAMSAIIQTSGFPYTRTKLIALVHLEIAFSTLRYLTIGRYYLFLHKQLIHLNDSIGFAFQLSCHLLGLSSSMFSTSKHMFSRCHLSSHHYNEWILYGIHTLVDVVIVDSTCANIVS